MTSPLSEAVWSLDEAEPAFEILSRLQAAATSHALLILLPDQSLPNPLEGERLGKITMFQGGEMANKYT